MLKTGKKLNFLSASKPWKSVLLKIFLFGLGLFGVYFFSTKGGSAFSARGGPALSWGGNLSFSALFVFFLLLLGLYFSQLPERSQLKTSFLILAFTALSAVSFFAGSLYLVIFSCFIFSFLFYLLSGSLTFIFKNRRSVYLFFNTCLFLIIFLLFFSVDKSKHYLIINFLLFSIIFFLFRECFGFLRSVIHNSLFIIHNSQFISLVFAFLGLELFWAISLLPIGFVNAAILLTLFIFLMRDFSLAYFSGCLNWRFSISHFLVFAILAILIFTTSKWSI